MTARDLGILGGGSAAFAAAEEALRQGARVVLIDRGPLGGTCLNRGCVPSKFLIDAAQRAIAQPHGPSFWRALLQEKARLIAEGRAAKRDFIRRHARRLRYVSGEGLLISAQRLDANGDSFTVAGSIIATGSRPKQPSFSGLNGVPFYTSDTIFDLPRLPRTLLIMGAGATALELGQMFAHLGVRVTLISDQARLLPQEEPELAEALSQRLRAQGVRLLLNRQAVAVRRNGREVALVLERGGSRAETIQAEIFFIAIGRVPNTDAAGLDALGIRRGPLGGIAVDAFLRTSRPRIWAAGDCVDCECPNRFVYVAKRQGEVAAHNALHPRAPRRMDYRVVPRVLFTDPELASVGLTERAARQKGIAVRVQCLPSAQVPRAWIRRATQGAVKLVTAAASGRLLGASLLLPRAGEVIHEAALGMQLGATAADFRQLFHAYPTFSEAIQKAAAAPSRD